MISKSAKNKIKRELKKGGNGYVSVISDYLNRNNIRTVKGEDYSESMIRLVMNMDVSHAVLEAAIFDCLKEQTQKNKEEQARRKRILDTVK